MEAQRFPQNASKMIGIPQKKSDLDTRKYLIHFD
jgi:hypothetical protein